MVIVIVDNLLVIVLNVCDFFGMVNNGVVVCLSWLILNFDMVVIVCRYNFLVVDLNSIDGCIMVF